MTSSAVISPNKAQGQEVDEATYTNYYERSFKESRYNFDACIMFADSGYQVALTEGDQYGADLAFYYRGVCFNRSGQYEQALIQFDSALTQFSAIPDSMRMADIIYQTALVHRQRTEHVPFINAINRSYDISKAINYRSKEGMSLNAKLIHYTERGLVEEGEKIGLEALKIFETLKDSSSMGDVLNNLGNLKTSVGLLDEAVAFHQRQHELNLAVNNIWGLGYSHGKLGGIYLTQGKTQLADYHLNAALDISRQNRTPYEMVGSLKKVARLYLKKGQITKALSLAEEGEALAEKHGQGNPHYEILELLSEIHEEKGDLHKSLAYHKEFSQVRNTTLNENIAQQLGEIETKYETEKKEAEIERLSLEDRLNEQKIIQQRFAIGGLGVGLSLLSFLLYRLFQQKKDIEEKNDIIKAALSEKDILLREIHHRVKNNLQVISSLLRIQSSNTNDETAIDALKEGQSRVQSMSLIHQDLYQKENLTSVSINKYFERLADNLFNTYNISKDRVVLKKDISPLNLDVDTVVPLGLILNELLTNALKYAFPNDQKGVVSVTIKQIEEQLFLEVRDNGVGLPETRGGESQSFGLKLVDVLSGKLEAEVKQFNDNGAVVQLHISEFTKVD